MTQPYLGIDDIIGMAMGDDAAEQLAQMLSGDSELSQLANLGLGIDDIIGAVARKATTSPQASQALANLAKLRAAGQHGVAQKPADNLKFESLPIPLNALNAGASVTVTVRPTRSMRLDRIRFPSSNVDHQFVALTSLQILGIEQLNGPGGILCSELSELCTEPGIRGNTMQAGQDVSLIFANLDTVNARSVRGSMSGPSLRV